MNPSSLFDVSGNPATGFDYTYHFSGVLKMSSVHFWIYGTEPM